MNKYTYFYCVFLMGIHWVNTYLTAAEACPLNRAARDTFTTRYEEITNEKHYEALPGSEQVILFTEALDIAQKMHRATTRLLTETQDDKHAKDHDKKQKLIQQHTTKITMWQLRVDNCESMIRTLNVENLVAQQKKEQETMLLHSNLFQNNPQALQAHYNTVHTLHEATQQQAAENPDDHAIRHFNEQVAQQSVLLQTFSKQMTRSRDTHHKQEATIQSQTKIIYAQTNKLNILQKQYDELNQQNAALIKQKSTEQATKNISDTKDNGCTVS
jgi:hypothetical protein